LTVIINTRQRERILRGGVADKGRSRGRETY
jgi:hypothetical protein